MYNSDPIAPVFIEPLIRTNRKDSQTRISDYKKRKGIILHSV